ncbi:MAG: ABC transporter ATP-binding protein [Gemmataceae bacterium]
MSVLVAENLSRSFGQGETRVTVLRDVALDLERGQLVLLMGPSGSGKSTLLATLSGLAKPDTGRVLSLGQDLWSMTEKQRERFRLRHCGFIFQGYNLFPSLTAREQLEMVLRLQGETPTGGGQPAGRRGAGRAGAGREGGPAARPAVRRREAASPWPGRW